MIRQNEERKRVGFTLLEILLVIAAIGILAAIVIVAINPQRQLAQVRNAERQSSVNTLANALDQYFIDNGSYPEEIDGFYREICRIGVGDSSDCIELDELIPTYIAHLPIDNAEENENHTGYQVAINLVNKKISIKSQYGELDELIVVNFMEPYATGGDEVYDIEVDGTIYRVHEFTTVGESQLEVLQDIQLEYLVIAGGGGGGGSSNGSRGGGGGGAGGYQKYISEESLNTDSQLLSLTISTLEITVGQGGQGGTGGVSTGATGISGNASAIIGFVEAEGGGGGGRAHLSVAGHGQNGGSGGGGGGSGGIPGTGVIEQGYGGGSPSGSQSGGGGGGAAEIGNNPPVVGTGGQGGNGISSSITGSLIWYAGGGGGGGRYVIGTGGQGGGADGRTGSGEGNSGVIGTGGGGGGVNFGNGGNGGSGIVIIRYPI